MTAPCGKPTNASRCGVLPATVCPHATPAGLMASSNGNAIAAPAPFSTVRRETCFFVMNMSLSLLCRCLRNDRRRRFRSYAHAERLARHYLPHQFRETIILFGCLAHDLAHRGHVPVIDGTPERIRQEPLRERLHELLGIAHQRLAQ